MTFIAGGLVIQEAGDQGLIADLPPASFRGAEDGLVLKRQAELPWEEGYLSSAKKSSGRFRAGGAASTRLVGHFEAKRDRG